MNEQLTRKAHGRGYELANNSSYLGAYFVSGIIVNATHFIFKTYT